MPKISIIFSSIGGNTKLVVDCLVDWIQTNSKVTVESVRAELVTEDFLSQINKDDILVLASPTYGQGTLENYMSKLLPKLKPYIKDQKTAIIGLGDIQYYPEYLSEASSILNEFVVENGGIIVNNPLKIGAKPLPYINKLIPRFAQGLIDNITKT
jgi:flavodoxin